MHCAPRTVRLRRVEVNETARTGSPHRFKNVDGAESVNSEYLGRIVVCLSRHRSTGEMVDQLWSVLDDRFFAGFPIEHIKHRRENLVPETAQLRHKMRTD